ncbi:hypothetical protein BpHYR1_043538, partial [Brachionus plicatilis]
MQRSAKKFNLEKNALENNFFNSEKFKFAIGKVDQKVYSKTREIDANRKLLEKYNLKSNIKSHKINYRNFIKEENKFTIMTKCPLGYSAADAEACIAKHKASSSGESKCPLGYTLADLRKFIDQAKSSGTAKCPFGFSAESVKSGECPLGYNKQSP